MRPTRRLRTLRGTTGIAVALLLGFAVGCDQFDPSVLMPSKTDAAAPATFAGGAAAAPEADARGAADPASGRQPTDPDMQSIGPDASQRIYYQFVDDRGRVQFVERLSDVPAAWRDRVGYVEMSQPPPLTPLEARRSWKLSEERTTEILLATASPKTRSRQYTEVVLYSADWCGYCTKARAHLDRSGVDYEVRDVDIEANAAELREKTGRGGIPVLDFSGEVLRGYSPDQYDRAIRSIQS